MAYSLTVYYCANARPGRQWLGHIDIPGTGSHALPFFGSTKDEVEKKMLAFYAREMAEC